jgi:hypothetical protein
MADDREDIVLGGVSRHRAGKIGPSEPEATLFYSELDVWKGKDGFTKITRIDSWKTNSYVLCIGGLLGTDFNKVRAGWVRGWVKSGFKAFGDYFVVSRRQKLSIFRIISKISKLYFYSFKIPFC